MSIILSTSTYSPILTGNLIIFPPSTPIVVLNILIGFLTSYNEKTFPLLHLFPVTV